jgi:hypothetical protein
MWFMRKTKFSKRYYLNQPSGILPLFGAFFKQVKPFEI